MQPLWLTYRNMLIYYTPVHVTGMNGIHLRNIKPTPGQLKLFLPTGCQQGWFGSFTQTRKKTEKNCTYPSHLKKKTIWHHNDNIRKQFITNPLLLELHPTGHCTLGQHENSGYLYSQVQRFIWYKRLPIYLLTYLPIYPLKFKNLPPRTRLSSPLLPTQAQDLYFYKFKTYTPSSSR